MRSLLIRLSPLLHLTRVTTAFAVVGNVWFVVLWSWESGEHEGGDLHSRSLALMLLGSAVTAVSLFAFAHSLNDLLDLRRDRLLNPRRPLPSGRLHVDTAVGLVVLSLIAAVLGATALGTAAILMTLLTAGAVFFYNAAARFVPSVGLVALSLMYGAHMMIPNVHLVFVWPVWLVMTHALLVAAVTHRLARRRPLLSPPAIVAATLGWVFWSGVLLYVGATRAGRLWPEWVPAGAAAMPAALGVAFIVLAWRKARSASTNAKAADKIGRYGALWLTLYETAWLLGQGHHGAALILGALAAGGFLGMTVLRELYALLEEPLEYRR